MIQENLFATNQSEIPILQVLRRIIKRDGTMKCAVRKYKPRRKRND